jgi:hypothetical protein
MHASETAAADTGGRRMTYAELAAVRGISVASAVRLVRRKRWLRQVGNDGVVRALVPPDEARKVTGHNDAGQSPDSQNVPPDILPDIRHVPPDILPDIRGVIREVIGPLSAQLEREQRRADRAESRADQAESALADAIAAERIAAGEAAALRAELERRRSWGLLRRLRGG